MEQHITLETHEVTTIYSLTLTGAYEETVPQGFAGLYQELNRCGENGSLFLQITMMLCLYHHDPEVTVGKECVAQVGAAINPPVPEHLTQALEQQELPAGHSVRYRHCWPI